MKNLLLILFCLLCCPTVKAEVAWFDGTPPVTYQVDGKVDTVVQIALRMFCNDMELVTGHKTVESKNAVIRIIQGKGNVLRCQALKKTPINVSKGQHILKVKALDNHIIMDQWMIDFYPYRQFYIIPTQFSMSLQYIK